MFSPLGKIFPFNAFFNADEDSALINASLASCIAFRCKENALLFVIPSIDGGPSLVVLGSIGLYPMCS